MRNKSKPTLGILCAAAEPRHQRRMMPDKSVRKERAWLEMCNQDLDVLEQRQGSAAAVTRSGMVSKAQSGEREL